MPRVSKSATDSHVTASGPVVGGHREPDRALRLVDMASEPAVNRLLRHTRFDSLQAHRDGVDIRPLEVG